MDYLDVSYNFQLEDVIGIRNECSHLMSWGEEKTLLILFLLFVKASHLSTLFSICISFDAILKV